LAGEDPAERAGCVQALRAVRFGEAARERPGGCAPRPRRLLRTKLRARGAGGAGGGASCPARRNLPTRGGRGDASAPAGAAAERAARVRGGRDGAEQGQRESAVSRTGSEVGR
jgi:hypothetical protein